MFFVLFFDMNYAVQVANSGLNFLLCEAAYMPKVTSFETNCTSIEEELAVFRAERSLLTSTNPEEEGFFKCCFASTETVRTIRDRSPGRSPPRSHSSWALKWWWCRASCPRMSVDILGTNCDQCRSMVQCCFTSTETVRLFRTERQGQPPRLSHSSWTLSSESSHFA